MQKSPSFHNSVWHPTIPNLQVVWDATSLASFMACPTKYKLHHIDGWSPNEDSIDLHFGSIFGSAMELYYKAVVEQGQPADVAQVRAISHALAESWDQPGGVQRFGSWEKVWRCEGLTPYKNEKGNKAKCPYSHAGKLFPGHGPDVCGKCGSTIERTEQLFSVHAVKTRLNLLRLVYFYTEAQKDAALEIMSIETKDSGGKPAHMVLAEVPWVVPFASYQGTAMHLAGWFDTVKRLRGTDAVFITDLKTTKNSLSNNYFAQYNPNVQVGVYSRVGMLSMKGLGPSGVAIEAFQLLENGVRYAMRTFEFTADQHRELDLDIADALARVVESVQTGHWPKNRTACFLCPFKRICALPEASRIPALKQDFARARWNPLKREKEVLPPLPEATLLNFPKPANEEPANA